MTSWRRCWPWCHESHRLWWLSWWETMISYFIVPHVLTIFFFDEMEGVVHRSVPVRHLVFLNWNSTESVIQPLLIRTCRFSFKWPKNRVLFSLLRSWGREIAYSAGSIMVLVLRFWNCAGWPEMRSHLLLRLWENQASLLYWCRCRRLFPVPPSRWWCHAAEGMIPWGRCRFNGDDVMRFSVAGWYHASPAHWWWCHTLFCYIIFDFSDLC